MRPPDALAPPSPVARGATAMNPADLLDQGPVQTPPRGPLVTLRKYLRIFRASLVERMAYRGDFLLGTFMRFLPMVTTILLWKAVYAGSGQSQLNGFDYREMIAYLLLTHISRMFSSMPGLAAGIAREIREGTLKRYMIQPVDLIGYLVAYRVAHKVAYIVTSALPYGLLFGFAWYLGFFERLPGPLTLAAFAISLVLAFLVGFFF